MDRRCLRSTIKRSFQLTAGKSTTQCLNTRDRACQMRAGKYPKSTVIMSSAIPTLPSSLCQRA
ncbi:rCG41273 [Rattus norvegicus]|uniref:RCG41273 n=1 Tax=Rattus norvegicus TaxID=10116 RepID=A6KND0_RAT|nr:rCG41273 [Rattus norvegicus]